MTMQVARLTPRQFEVYEILKGLANKNNFVCDLTQKQLTDLYNEAYKRGIPQNSFWGLLDQLSKKRLIDIFKISQPYRYYVNSYAPVENIRTGQIIGGRKAMANTEDIEEEFYGVGITFEDIKPNKESIPKLTDEEESIPELTDEEESIPKLTDEEVISHFIFIRQQQRWYGRAIIIILVVNLLVRLLVRLLGGQ